MGLRRVLGFGLAWSVLLGGIALYGQAPAIATTMVADTVYKANGTAAGGTVLISWPGFTLATGASVPAGSTSATIGAGGALNVPLVSNAGATPLGSYYTVVYHLNDGSVTREYWVVPVSLGPVRVSAIRSTVLISWPGFTLATGASVPAGSTSATIGAGGALNVPLVSNAGATPLGSYYTVVYHLNDGSVTREYWVVPVSLGPVRVSAIRSTVLPTSVAMQTVSKAYVDTAIALAVTGHPLSSSTPYVLKTGDAMTGPLDLPGDPGTPTQASDKHYVNAQIAGVTTGLAQKVTTVPQSTQVVAQPAGTDLEVNRVNGTAYASQYVTGAGTANAGNNGIANATASPDCGSGCDVVAEQTYHSNEVLAPTSWNSATRVEDLRGGMVKDTYFNPHSAGGLNAGQTIDVASTASAKQVHAEAGAQQIFSTGLVITSEGLTGGSNEYPRALQGTVPYFKTTYTALNMTGTYNTPGQHVLYGGGQNCYGVGDCLMGGLFMTASGGFRDDADEGAHPFDLSFTEDDKVFQGTCAGGCTPGSTTVQVAVTANAGTQGEGRYVIDTNPAKVISNEMLVGGVTTGPLPTATFAGTNFPVSTQLQTAQTIPTQASEIAPGTVTVAIVTGSVPAGYATNTAALAQTSGVACVSDARPLNGRPMYFETAAYTVIDGSHIQLTLSRPHGAGATIAVGGLCGYGLEQLVDTQAGIRQVFPVIASTSPTSVTYAGGQSSIVGQQGYTSAFANLNLVVANIARTGNVVSVTIAGTLSADVSGLTMTVQGVTDPSYNGSFAVTTTGPNTLTYVANGPDSTSAGGTILLVTGRYALYPMAEVQSVYNPLTKAVDGQLNLAANTIPWAAGDTLEEPHYFQEAVSADTEMINQTTPRPSRRQSAGIIYGTNNGPGMVGWEIANGSDGAQYFGYGGTHTAPNTGISVAGVWQNAFETQAGERAVMRVHCNSHGCGKWNSGYDLFGLDTSAGQDNIHYTPQTSALTFGLRGAGYQFTPQGFTANTINVTTLNAGAIHGMFTGTVGAQSLPVFAPSGNGHQIGAVPDPGPTAGQTRFLREDGTWVLAGGTTQVSSASVYTTVGPTGLPQRSSLLGEYLLTEGTGTVAHDTSGQGNDATVNGPAWEGTQDLDFRAQGQFVQLPGALNAAKAWQFAMYVPVFGSAVAPQAPGYGRTTSFPANPTILCGTDAAHMCLIAGSPGKSMQFQAFNTDGTGAGEAIAPGWHVVTLLCGSNVGGVVKKTRLLYDGAEVGSYISQGDGATCPNPASGNYQLGGSAQYTQTWWMGKIAAAWAWNTQLSFGDGVTAAQSALAYLKTKGVQTTFRSVTQSTPLILAGFDSRTFGIGLTSTQVWPAAMTLTDTTYQRVNLGSPGQTAFDACMQFDLTYAEQVGTGSGPAIAVLWGGVNDMLYTGQTTRQIANSLRCMTQRAKAAGARVVLATEISCANSATCDAGKDALNGVIRSEAFGWGVDDIADLATDARIGADGASANTACFPDNLHPGATCETYVTAVMQDAVNELIGSTETNRHTTAAATYVEVAGDRYLDLTGVSAQTVTLPDCTGYSLRREVLNLGTAGATVNAVNGQVLVGSTAIAPNTRGVFVPVPGASAVGGCRWQRTE